MVVTLEVFGSLDVDPRRTGPSGAADGSRHGMPVLSAGWPGAYTSGPGKLQRPQMRR